MVQGTTSDAGKTVMVTGLCRVLARRGVSVAPFKPQNMALNSAVTPEQGEIGRAQALQAQAARLPPHTDMNPLLLKPSSDTAAQVIIHGRAASHMEAQDYHQYKRIAMEAVLASWQRLCRQHECLIVEGAGQAIPGADLVILPGSKNVRADLDWLRAHGWDQAITRHLRYGGKLLGICGGYQMLGEVIDDPLGVEDEAGRSEGLGLLPLHTRLRGDKALRLTTGTLQLDGSEVQGYEIHCGDTQSRAPLQPFALLADGNTDGVIADDGQIAGTYLHGLFDTAAACQALLQWAGLEDPVMLDRSAIREAEIERLADCLEAHLDLAKLFPRWLAA